MKKRIIALLLTSAIIIPVLSWNISAQTPHNGVALGDSVAAFFGVDESDGYVAQLSALLKSAEIDNEFINLAVSGLNTQTLLEQLAKSDISEKIKNADIITLNIGGNNILSPFTEILSSEFESLMTADMTQLSPVVLLEFINKKITDQQMELLMENIALFQKDFPEIINILHAKAPNSAIFVNTVYNPITPLLGMYEASEILIPLMNSFISENAEKLDYIVVDVYSLFKESPDNLTNFNLLTGSVDIHPNPAGHALIAEAAAKKISENIFANESPASDNTDNTEENTTPNDSPEIEIPPNNAGGTEPSEDARAENAAEDVVEDAMENATKETTKDATKDAAEDTRAEDAVEINTYVPPTGDEAPQLVILLIFTAAAFYAVRVRKNNTI